MASRRLLRLRKESNAFYRSCIRHSYATSTEISTEHEHEIQNPLHTATDEEKNVFLQKEDGKLLIETEHHVDALIAHINKVKDHIAAMPTTIQLDPRIKVPYTLGVQRSTMRTMPEIANTAIARAENVKAHLIDLQYEPYPDASKLTEGWEKEMAAMTTSEMEAELKNLKLQEEAEAARLQRDAEGLKRQVREIEAMGKKGVSLDDLVKMEYQFGSANVKSAPALKPVANATAKPVAKDTKAAQEEKSVAKPVVNAPAKTVAKDMDAAQEETSQAKPMGLPSFRYHGGGTYSKNVQLFHAGSTTRRLRMGRARPQSQATAKPVVEDVRAAQEETPKPAATNAQDTKQPEATSKAKPAPEAAASPVAKDVQTAKDEPSKAKPAQEATPPAKHSSLLDLQKQLEKSYVVKKS